MSKIIKDAAILFVITLVAGVLLGGVYEITKAPIERQNELAKQKAYQAVIADADSFEAIEHEKYGNIEVPVVSDNYPTDEIAEVVAGVKDGKITGYVVTVVAGDGYGGDIKFSVGLSTEGECKGISILSISETAGLGMRAKTDPSFASQYVGKTVDKFSVVKDGTGSSADDKIDSIGGSTITSSAVTNGVNAALDVYKELKSANVKTVGGASIE